ISTYLLAGVRRKDQRSNEASLKYFLLGSFATAFFLYGIAFVYGVTGTTKLVALSQQGLQIVDSAQGAVGPHQVLSVYPHVGDPGLMWLAMILLFVGLAFKVSTVPFQIWLPDVSQGAPAPVAAFLSVGPKAAAFAAVLRIFLGGFALRRMDFSVVWITSAVLTMSLGNLAALRQSNVKRLLAYSAIAHAGYVLVGISAA